MRRPSLYPELCHLHDYRPMLLGATNMLRLGHLRGRARSLDALGEECFAWDSAAQQWTLYSAVIGATYRWCHCNAEYEASFFATEAIYRLIKPPTQRIVHPVLYRAQESAITARLLSYGQAATAQQCVDLLSQLVDEETARLDALKRRQ